MGEVNPTEQMKKVSLIMKEKHINISLVHLQERPGLGLGKSVYIGLTAAPLLNAMFRIIG